MKRLAAIAAIAAMTTFGGAVAADDYPPAGGATTVPVKPGGGGGRLPATGSDSTSTMQIAGGVLIAGLGLTAVAWHRRRPTTAAV